MRLQKQLSRKVNNKEYQKWVVAIPPKQISELQWKEGEFLESEIVDQVLVIKKEDEQELEKRKEAAIKAWETRKERNKKEM